MPVSEYQGFPGSAKQVASLPPALGDAEREAQALKEASELYRLVPAALWVPLFAAAPQQ